MLKYVAAILLIVFLPQLASAEERKISLLSGTWFVYGFALYQPLDRTITMPNGQDIYKSKFFYGFGLGKDHLRLEYAMYLSKPRFMAAFDVFPNAIATPYIGYVYGRGALMVDQSGVRKVLVERGDAAIGLTFQPIKFASIYAEYLVRDQFFFAGVRIKLPYTFN